MKMLIILNLLMAQSAYSGNEHSKTFVQNIKIGHNDVSSIEIKKDFDKKGSFWTLKIHRNGVLLGGRALTEKTYNRIQEDWAKNIIDKKTGSECGDPVVITQSHGSDLKVNAICIREWTMKNQKSFNEFHNKLRALALGQSSIY